MQAVMIEMKPEWRIATPTLAVRADLRDWLGKPIDAGVAKALLDSLRPDGGRGRREGSD